MHHVRPSVIRHTFLVTGVLARREALYEAVRSSAHGRQILGPAQLAARLAGGFAQPIDRDALLDAVDRCLTDATLDIGDLAAIRDLPGSVRAAAQTLSRVWNAGIDLAVRAGKADSPRLAELARLEAAVLQHLPAAQFRPQDLAHRALDRRQLAPRLLGAVTLAGMPDLDPVWRPLLRALGEVVPMTWRLGHFRRPAWVDGDSIEFDDAAANTPELLRVSCANPRHEALEALRWARALIASGAARPEEIAIAAPANAEWDEHIAAMADDANLPLAFVHGRPALNTPDGQTCAALAEVLLNGLSRSRVERVLTSIRGATDATRGIPGNWQRILPRDAPLLHAQQWRGVIEGTTEWPEGRNFGATLEALIDLLDRGAEAASEAGERLLAGRARAVWRKALKEGPARALAVSLAGVRVEEQADPVTSIVWCAAAEVASCPRPYVRLLGLTSRGWPRTQSEDPLLPAHIVDPGELDPVPVPERDRRDFRTAAAASSRQVVLSRFRRDAEGRQAGESALLRELRVERGEGYLRRERIPEHAASEADRLLARPDEFAADPVATHAVRCWKNWHTPKLTPHDGRIRAQHPILVRILQERFSATRLRRLVRDPLGFVWRYGLHWQAPAEDEEPLGLDSAAFGSLTHRVLELAVNALEAAGGLADADAAQIAAATVAAVDRAADEYERTQPVPPRLLWRRTLTEVRDLARTALAWDDAPLPGQRSFAEIEFGYVEATARSGWPWDPGAAVEIPGTGLLISGTIDRLDLSADGAVARVTDYKTGKVPGNNVQVNGGEELQRCLYAFAVQALLGTGVAVAARLLYARDGGRLLDLADPQKVLDDVAHYFVAARDHLRVGRALVGPDSGRRDDDPLTFALPGNAKENYLVTKAAEAQSAMAPLPELWEMP